MALHFNGWIVLGIVPQVVVWGEGLSHQGWLHPPSCSLCCDRLNGKLRLEAVEILCLRHWTPAISLAPSDFACALASPPSDDHITAIHASIYLLVAVDPCSRYCLHASGHFSVICVPQPGCSSTFTYLRETHSAKSHGIPTSSGKVSRKEISASAAVATAKE